MEGVTILGAGGHGRDVQAIADACGVPVLGLLDDAYGKPWDELDSAYVFGVHDPRTRARRDMIARSARTLIHPSSYFDPMSEVHDGVVVAARAVVGNGCTIGRHVHIGQCASLVRTYVSRYATISPGAIICGDVTIGEGAYIGAGAVVSNLCIVGPYATVGAGAVLPPHTEVPAHSVWVGVPARPLRDES